VRVIGPDGAQLGILPIEQALETAFKLQLDLVEVAPEARPPVCRIMDYGKYRYEQAKKAREARKKQTVIELKEIKLRPKTEEHDFQFKARHAERFLREGNKAKITMMFRGREVIRMDRGRAVLDRFVEALKDVAVVEQPAKVEGRNMSMILAPKSGRETGPRPPANPPASTPPPTAPQ
jgi:translation initiation factor IF-3